MRLGYKILSVTKGMRTDIDDMGKSTQLSTSNVTTYQVKLIPVIGLKPQKDFVIDTELNEETYKLFSEQVGQTVGFDLK
jgi:hypothetical protein